VSYHPNVREIERHHQELLLKLCITFLLMLKYKNPILEIPIYFLTFLKIMGSCSHNLAYRM